MLKKIGIATGIILGLVAKSELGDNNLNIVSATEMVQNDTSSMLKRAHMQRTGIDSYTGGVASNLHTQVDMAAKAIGITLDKVSVEVVNDFHWDRMLDSDAWAAGQALINKTPVTPTLIVNGENWSHYKASPGTTESVESYDGELNLALLLQQ